MRILILLGLGAASALNAQPRVQARMAAPGAPAAEPVPVLSLPVMGFIPGEGPAELRPMVGLPGSAVTGNVVRMPDGVRRVHLSPGQAFALVERAGAPVGLLPFNHGAPGDILDITGALARIDLAAFGPSGNYAVLHALEGSRVQVIAITGGAARVSSEIAVPALTVRRLAVDDSGAVTVAITDDGGVYLVGNGAPRQVYRGGAITDAAFLPGKPSLLVAEAQPGRVTLIDGLPDSPSTRVLGLIDNDGQVWARPSTDGKYVFAAGSGRRVAWRVEIASGAVRTVDLPEETAGLDRLGNSNAFVYSSAGGPVWLLLGDDPDLRSVFSPGPDAPGKRGIRK